MRIYSIFLPAFHQDKINDEIWGEGFTEWDNVKLGVPLYKGHNQPLVPYNQNYYDLSRKETLEWQIKIAKDYLIDGFIFYHYWFGDDIMSLEKPAELLLKLDEKIDFCFCWANHSWATTWHGRENQLIVEQKYGEEDEWKKHFEYLLPFFQDSNYIKIENKPVIYIYNMSEIHCRDKMFKYWEDLAKYNGFDGLYVVEYISSKNRKANYIHSNAIVEFEPLYTAFFDVSKATLLKRFICKTLHMIDFQNYNQLWDKIIRRKRTYSGRVIHKGCFVGWDNSARKGRNSTIVLGASSSNFRENLVELINNKRKDSTNDFIVVNAWNEWGEGAMLEPSETDKFSYLEQIRSIKIEFQSRNDKI